MLLLISAFISAAGLVWGFIYGLSWPGTLTLVLKMIFRESKLVQLAASLLHCSISLLGSLHGRKR